MLAQPWDQTETRRVAELIKDIDICMLVTRADGTVRGRPMSNNGGVEYDGTAEVVRQGDARRGRRSGTDDRAAPELTSSGTSGVRRSPC